MKNIRYNLGGEKAAAGTGEAQRAPRLRLLPALLLAFFATSAAAQDGSFQLGTVVVTGAAQGAEQGAEQVLGKDAIQKRNADTVGSAVVALPGTSLSRNSRNEDTVSLRGFDSRQVPMFVDGVPLYVPYDGYIDFARFTTFDLSEIRVAKAGASLLYGPNTLGGAINLVTRKPVASMSWSPTALAGWKRRAAALSLRLLRWPRPAFRC